MSSPEDDDQPTAGAQAAAISNLVVRLMSDYTGRGPTRARTYMAVETFVLDSAVG